MAVGDERLAKTWFPLQGHMVIIVLGLPENQKPCISQNRCTSINKTPWCLPCCFGVKMKKPEQNTPFEKDTDICGVVSDMSAKHAGIVNSGVFFHSITVLPVFKAEKERHWF